MPHGDVPSTTRILNKALALFSQKGYDATSVREICEAAEITKPTLYHFFGSKEGVYRALVEGALEGFRQRLAEELGAPGSPREQLKRVARTYFQVAREQSQLMRFLFALIHNPPSSAPRTDFPRYYGEMVALISGVVETGVAEGTFSPGPLDLRMLAYMGALAETMIGYLILGRPDLDPELADRLVDVVVQGWSATKAAPQ
jgi:AcrR family transcriptional regulator